MPDDQAYKDARKQTFHMCRAYASILGERLAKPLQKIKPDPEARHLLSSVASRSKLLEAFDNELSLTPWKLATPCSWPPRLAHRHSQPTHSRIKYFKYFLMKLLQILHAVKSNHEASIY